MKYFETIDYLLVKQNLLTCFHRGNLFGAFLSPVAKTKQGFRHSKSEILIFSGLLLFLLFKCSPFHFTEFLSHVAKTTGFWNKIPQADSWLSCQRLVWETPLKTPNTAVSWAFKTAEFKWFVSIERGGLWPILMYIALFCFKTPHFVWWERKKNVVLTVFLVKIIESKCWKQRPFSPIFYLNLDCCFPVMTQLAHSSPNKKHATHATFAKVYEQSACQDPQKSMQLTGNVATAGAESRDLDT